MHFIQLLLRYVVMMINAVNVSFSTGQVGAKKYPGIQNADVCFQRTGRNCDIGVIYRVDSDST
jgi:hypothetical protein